MRDKVVTEVVKNGCSNIISHKKNSVAFLHSKCPRNISKRPKNPAAVNCR